ncbi:ATP-binding cassette domain-containing protein [Bergeyella zoohelcum]|uniref:ATP-binding cassette domain-containing protein n=1 Tax=Bergeyella zoohelcum TaxID=1015 RepID=UPI002A90C4EE|nr:ATP-binding cassette domain-containing protein [Bergeyella zoohelcum]MDY6025609.1 ATP-binding cassette domain-containing protein [Bergeyella zoohelcum]
MLSIKDLEISYKNTSVIKGLNLEIKEGEIIGILGKNGAGKTTLFNALYQNINYHGESTYRDIPISRKNVSFLETENYFYPYMTGEEYLSFFLQKGYIKNFKNLIDKFDLPLNKFVQNYSTGMKKKLALIGTILLDKPINILDEPFNGMDFEGVHTVYEVIKDMKSNHKIVLISSHIIETLFNTCDKIAVLQNGMIEKIIEKKDFNKENATFVTKI